MDDTTIQQRRVTVTARILRQIDSRERLHSRLVPYIEEKNPLVRQSVTFSVAPFKIIHLSLTKHFQEPEQVIETQATRCFEQVTSPAEALWKRGSRVLPLLESLLTCRM